ncbi:hypothetical protein EJ08DRAFT_567349, partial [Tothia fuscella]
MSEITPKRIILKCPQEYFRDWTAMITAFFDSQGLEAPDYFSHTVYDPSSPSKLFLVLDLNYKEMPDVNLNNLELQVLKVTKGKTFTFTDLGERAQIQARPRSLDLGWATDKPNRRS